MKPARFLILLTAALAFVACVSLAEDKALGVGTTSPEVDGVVKAGEYAVQKDFGPMRISLSRTADTLFVAASANNKGWIAVGLGTNVMNGATIFMGFVGDDGKVQFKPQTGSGHTHADPSGSAAMDSVVSYAVKEELGKTTLELALKADSYIKGGQSTLDMIFAIGPAKAFSPYHVFRAFQKVPLAP
jgi:hypothetical protein